MRRLAPLFLFILAACASPAPVPPPVGLVPDAGGLQPNGTALRIDFGRAEAGVIAAVSRLRGVAPDGRAAVPGCGDVVAWDDGLRLFFSVGDVRGWAFQGRSAGVVCG